MNELQSPGKLLRVVFQNLWSLQMSILAYFGILPVFQRHPWLFMPLAGLLFVAFPPLGIFFIVTGLVASFTKPDDSSMNDSHSSSSESPFEEKRKPTTAGSRLGVEVGEVVREFFEQPFRNNEVKMPEDLFCDPYLAGYAFHSTKVMGVGERLFSLSKDDRARYYMSAFETICGSELAVQNMALDQDDSDFKRGERHAALYSTAALDPSRLDDSEVLVQQAKELAGRRASDFRIMRGGLNRHSPDQEGGLNNENEAFAWAIQRLTLIDYIEENYMSEPSG